LRGMQKNVALDNQGRLQEVLWNKRKSY
jgi:hypothetical protein